MKRLNTNVQRLPLLVMGRKTLNPFKSLHSVFLRLIHNGA